MSCSIPMSMAFANFAKVAFLCLAWLFSNLARAGCFIPALEARSACVRAKCSRHALMRLSPRTLAFTTSLGNHTSSSFVPVWLKTSAWYSSQGITAKAGLPFWVMIWGSICALISFLYLLDFDDSDITIMIEKNSIAAYSHTIVVTMFFESCDAKAFALRKFCELINALQDGLPVMFRDFLNLSARSVVPYNMVHRSNITKYNIKSSGRRPSTSSSRCFSRYAKSKEVDIAQELGAGTYIMKPYTLEKVGVAVKKELEELL